MEGMDEDKGGVDQEVVRHVRKIISSQMAILQALDVPSCAQRGRRGAQGRGETLVRAQTCRQDPSDSDDSLTGSSNPRIRSHRGESC